MLHRLRHLLACALWSLAGLPTAFGQELPASVQAALQQAGLPPQAISVVVQPAGKQAPTWIDHQADQPVNPASLMKLITTTAALDLLGPNYSWRTPVWLDGRIRNGVLEGHLVLRGQGDPTLVLERLWLLLRRVQALGVHTIHGDIVLDRSAFAVERQDPAAFDGAPLRPYNANPDALLINFNAIQLTFTPDTAAGVARVQLDPPLLGVTVAPTIPLTRTTGCGDYRGTLQPDWRNPKRIRFAGRYPSACEEKVWPVAYADPEHYNARAIAGLWRAMGGQLKGQVRDGTAPEAPPTFEWVSPPLAEVVRDINKFSNNVMAQQLFYTLGWAPPAIATAQSARDALTQWWQRRIDLRNVPTFDNGSGLSRQNRITARQLVLLMQTAYASPFMPELMASLPIVGLDGTLKRSQARTASAHLKTGSLQGVMGLAGYVHGPHGVQVCLVAIVNHPNAQAARPVLDALVDWVADSSARPFPAQ